MSADDYWTVNGSRDFAILPASTIAGITVPAPIRLYCGDPGRWGESHVTSKHGHWLNKIRMTAAEALWFKCQQPGRIYCTEGATKYTFHLSLNPDALLVVEYKERVPELSVTTLYFRGGPIDGSVVGHYMGVKHAGPKPTFALVAKPPTKIITKKRKTIILPS